MPDPDPFDVAAAVVHGVRAAVLAGCSTVVLTNASGSLRPDWPVGGPVLIADHVNLTGHNPLAGPLPPPPSPARF
jgi:purine-nucleoside phosphorylase